MGRLTLITGGAASGKSTYALQRGQELGPRVLFVATCVARDEEMRAKVARHRHERPASWTTVETARNVAAAFGGGFDGANDFDAGDAFDGAIVDCLTLLVSELLLGDVADAGVLAEVRRLCEAARAAAYPVLLVTNEVGQGVVPEHPLGRRFRDLQGRVNQMAAAAADEVQLIVCGLPMRIKYAG